MTAPPPIDCWPCQGGRRGHSFRENGADVMTLVQLNATAGMGCGRESTPEIFCAAREVESNSSMAGFDHEPERAWDEYQWERFLQQQDHKTEKYMDLLEKYLDDPNRDQIIAREMGWTQLFESNDWSQEIDALLEEEAEERQADTPPPDTFEEHSLYRAAFALTVWIDQMFDEDSALQNEPSAVKLATHAALTSAKLAAALSGEGVDEIGMTIAYLKRALKAITLSLDGAAALLREKRVTPGRHSVLLQRLFEVRDGIVTLIGEYRFEWRRRFGSEDFGVE